MDSQHRGHWIDPSGQGGFLRHPQPVPTHWAHAPCQPVTPHHGHSRRLSRRHPHFTRDGEHREALAEGCSTAAGFSLFPTASYQVSPPALVNGSRATPTTWPRVPMLLWQPPQRPALSSCGRPGRGRADPPVLHGLLRGQLDSAGSLEKPELPTPGGHPSPFRVKPHVPTETWGPCWDGVAIGWPPRTLSFRPTPRLWLGSLPQGR